MFNILQQKPFASYNCGWMVLNRLATSVRGAGLNPANSATLYAETNLFQSCSMRTLLRVGQSEGFPLVAVERPPGASDLPIPAIMHLSQGHYIALLSTSRGFIQAYDPLLGTRYFRAEVLNAEGSGRFLVPSPGVRAGWRLLSDGEAATTLGRSAWDGGFLDKEETFCEDCERCPLGFGGGSGGAGGAGGSGSHGGLGNHGGIPNTGGQSDQGQNQGTTCAGCPRGAQSGQGMVQWRVTEPNVTLWLHDRPITCQGAYGPAVSFELMFKQHDDIYKYPNNTFGFGARWNSPWLSWAEPHQIGFAGGGGGGSVTVYLPGGGAIEFNFPNGQTQATDYYYNTRVTADFTDGDLIGFTLDYPDGRQRVYRQAWNNGFYMTCSIDEKGFATLFNYDVVTPPGGMAGLRLTTVHDQASHLLYSLGYDSGTTYPHTVSSVTDRFGLTALLVHVEVPEGPPHLQQITDAAGLTSFITYDGQLGWPQTLTTPYGTTTFSFQVGMWENGLLGAYRWAIVTEPNNGRQIFLYCADSSALWNGNPWLPAQFDSSLIPDVPYGSMLDNDPIIMNTFYWNQKQTLGLPADPTLFTTNHMNKARMRHWLNHDTSGRFFPDFALSLEVSPSQDIDGSIFGQITWLDYAGKIYTLNPGTQIEPSLIARKLPDGSTWYESYQRNSFGLPTSRTSTYGVGNPAPTRTYSYVYDSNGQDLLEERRPGNELVRSFTYNDRHQVLTETAWPDDLTSYTTAWVYDAQGRVETETTAGGQTRTYTYNASCGSYGGYLSDITDSPVARTESFTWLNGYVRTHTDFRGLTPTYTRDGLDRLTQIDYPAHDGIASRSIRYGYALLPGQGFNTTGDPIPILEVTAITNRLNKFTLYGRDPLGRVVTLTDPLNHTTTYTYCGCGGVESALDARNKTTTFTYNNAGWKTGVVYGDNTTEAYGYDSLGRMTCRSDSLGSRTFTYNNQGLLIGITSSVGQELALDYDINDMPTTRTDANSVTVTSTFDRLGRQLTRSVPGQNTEVFGYSALGPISYTGPDQKSTAYDYDAAGRKITETTPKTEIIRYTNSAAGDLLSLTDGRSKTTTWTYDIEGLVRTKKYHGQSFANIEYSYDAGQRLSWRKFWSSPTQNKQTSYGYDDANNLTSIDYPTSPDVSFTYNEVNQKATMTTVGLGTTTFYYNDAEEPAGEGGLWANDALTLTYHATVPGLRAGVSLQQPSGSWSQTYTYDAARRLQTLTSPAGTFTYTYRGAGTLWTNLALPNTSAITNAYDNAARLTSTWLMTSAGVNLNKHAYLYDIAGRRQQQTLTDGSYTTYGYDDDSQLSSSLGYTAGGTPIASEQLGFTYDAGFNMSQRSVNGSPTYYHPNDLNELINVGTTYFTYDTNGNTLTNGNLFYIYDDENRLVAVGLPGTQPPPPGGGGHGPLLPAPPPNTGGWKSAFTYDGLGRLRVRQDYYSTTNGGWYLTNAVRYAYDGNRVIREQTTNNVPAVVYTRGPDLSGTLEGAGGIGGLLARSHGYSGGSWSTHNFYHADGNGNITYLVNSSQALAATYKYDPYGGTIVSSGSLAGANQYRFSSKEIHASSGLCYYLYRFYNPNLQRWINRDPMTDLGDSAWRSFPPPQAFWFPGEAADEPSPYLFAANDPVAFVDPWGQEPIGPTGIACVACLIALGGDCSYLCRNGTWDQKGEGFFACMTKCLGSSPFASTVCGGLCVIGSVRGTKCPPPPGRSPPPRIPPRKLPPAKYPPRK